MACLPASLLACLPGRMSVSVSSVSLSLPPCFPRSLSPSVSRNCKYGMEPRVQVPQTEILILQDHPCLPSSEVLRDDRPLRAYEREAAGLVDFLDSTCICIYAYNIQTRMYIYTEPACPGVAMQTRL